MSKKSKKDQQDKKGWMYYVILIFIILFFTSLLCFYFTRIGINIFSNSIFTFTSLDTLYKENGDGLLFDIIAMSFIFIFFALRRINVIDKKFIKKYDFLGSFLFIIIFALLLFWYFEVWKESRHKEEAFSSLMSALAFWGLIGTILVQIFKHRENHDAKLRELRADYLAREIDFLREKRGKLEDKYINLKLKEKSLMTPEELKKRNHKLKYLSLKIEKYRYRTILLNKEFGKLIPSFASKKLKKQKKRVKDLKDTILPKLVSNKNITIKTYKKRQEKLFKKAIK